MILGNCEMRPGRVLEFKEGIIKADVPGLFSMVDKDKLPPIYPFFGSHEGQYSMLNEGDEVWVLFAKDNPRQLHWFRKDPTEVIEGKNVEVIVNRDVSHGSAMLMFEDGSGWIMSHGESKIVVSANGIDINTGLDRRYISINGSGIELGGSTHQAAYGDVSEELFELVYSALDAIRQAADTNVYTKPIALALAVIPKQLKSKIPDVSSNIVNLD